MIERDPKYYVTGHKGQEALRAPFYLRALVFDGPEGDLNTRLVNAFNDSLRKKDMFPGCRLDLPPRGERCLPAQIVIINASGDDLPTSHETARVFRSRSVEKGYDFTVNVVNSRRELTALVDNDPERTLIISQCVDKKVYDVAFADELEKRRVVIVPGRHTAPGSIFSDKNASYHLLSAGGEEWTRVARYRKVSVEKKTTADVVSGIFAAIEDLKSETGQTMFFVKPHEGGGGLGGFRIVEKDGGYIIPDLSKVSGESSEAHPVFIDVDASDTAKLREILWIYRLFANDKKMSANYLKIKLPVTGDDARDVKVIRDYLSGCAERRAQRVSGMIITRDAAEKRLINAIDLFERKFAKRYVALVNEHLDFGLWGLRAHYRLARQGPVLETIYHRIFQLTFTAEGIGYTGSDNISNKQTGDLEIMRLGPLNATFLEAIGGQDALFASLIKGAEALAALAELLPPEDVRRVPLRLQIDLAAVARRIGEGNADTARGLCLASRWSEFVRNAQGWLEDSLAYYAWKKRRA
ncbi:MAG: hypothetical protein ABIH74_06170 [Candidatus Omnitrophota bacterium]